MKSTFVKVLRPYLAPGREACHPARCCRRPRPSRSTGSSRTCSAPRTSSARHRAISRTALMICTQVVPSYLRPGRRRSSARRPPRWSDCPTLPVMPISSSPDHRRRPSAPTGRRTTPRGSRSQRPSERALTHAEGQHVGHRELAGVAQQLRDQQQCHQPRDEEADRVEEPVETGQGDGAGDSQEAGSDR